LDKTVRPVLCKTADAERMPHGERKLDFSKASVFLQNFGKNSLIFCK
jgi:hypothetical protein